MSAVQELVPLPALGLLALLEAQALAWPSVERSPAQEG